MDKPTPEKKLRVYCETSFWSYLNGHPTPLQHIAVKQAATLQWWQEIAEQYGHDVNCYFDAMIARQSESESQGAAFVRLPIARVAPAMV